MMPADPAAAPRRHCRRSICTRPAARPAKSIGWTTDPARTLNAAGEPLVVTSYVNGFPTAVPAQLVEYTFAAQGPPLDPTLGIDRTIGDFDISAVDEVYAFSIDDVVAFKSLPGDGIVVTVAGSNGLANPIQTPLPTASTYRSYCEGGSAIVGSPPGGLRLLPWLLQHYRITVDVPARPDWGKGVIRSMNGSLAKVRFEQRGTITLDVRSAGLAVVGVRWLN